MAILIPTRGQLRPALAPEDRATPRGSSSLNYIPPIPRTEAEQDWDEQEQDGEDEDVDAAAEEEKRPLAGMQFTTTGKLESANREEVRRMCSTLGATFEPVLAVDATFLLADRTEGDKYRVSDRSTTSGR